MSRKDRECRIAERKIEFANAERLNIWLQKREQLKRELGIELRGDVTMEEESFLKAQIEDKLKNTRSLQKSAEEATKKLQSMEEAFIKLKQVTGVRAVEEMHEKFSNQRSNKSQLENDVKDAEQRLSQAKKVAARLESHYQELKSSGGGLAELNREHINKLEEAFNDAKNDHKFIKADSERLATILLGLHQGAHGLLLRVNPYLSLAEGNLFELTQLGEEQDAWTETVDALTTTEQVLGKMMEAISGDGAAQSPGIFEGDDESAVSHSSIGATTIEDEAPNDVYNVRIKSKKFFRELDERERPDEFGTFDREKRDDLLLESLNMTDEGIKDSIYNSNLDKPEDPNIPSRLAVKKYAARLSTEALRKEEMELRRKRILDRMENKFQGGGAAADDALMKTAKFKAQKEAVDRLCVERKSTTLPDGVTLRDDPMTKTNAFLQSVPKLT